MQKRFVLGLAMITVVVASGCRFDRNPLRDEISAAPAPTPPPAPLQQAPVVAPVAAPVAPPVAAPAPIIITRTAPAAPAQTVFVVTAPKADPVAACRQRFTSECTGICNGKVNAQTVPGSTKRRIEHDICFGECTRAANRRCN